MPGNPLNITLPDVGVTAGPTYATEINLALQTIIDDVEAKVTPDEIVINDDLDFSPAATPFAAINLDRVHFEAKGSLPGTSIESIFVYDDNLYFQDGAGTNIAITTAGAIAGAPGNITSAGSPTYDSLTDGIQWSGGDLEYIFTDDGTNDYAGLVFLDAQFRNGVNSMTMESAVTTDYTVTWPAVAPTGTELVQVNSSGVVSFSSTVVDATTFTGLVTASAGVTAVGNQDFTVSGTGNYNHGDFVLWIPGSAGNGRSAAGAYAQPETLSVSTWESPGASAKLTIPIELKVGKVIESVVVHWDSHGASGTKYFRVYEQDIATLSGASTLATSTSTFAGVQATTVISTPVSVVSGTTYSFQFQSSAGGGEEIVAIAVTYSE